MISKKRQLSAHLNNSIYNIKLFFKRLYKIEHFIPYGIKVLLSFTAFMGIIYIILASMFSFTIVLGFVITGAFARLINIFIIIIIAFILYGILKKKIWSYRLLHIFFVFVILNSLVSMFYIKKGVSGFMTLLVTFSFFFLLLMNVITLWYVRHKKTYFMHHYHTNHVTKDDKAFIYGLTFLWLSLIFTSCILGNSFYEETKEKIDILIDDLNSNQQYNVEAYCIDKGIDKDLCLLTSAIIYENDLNVFSLCKSIDSYFYRYTCFKAIQGDMI